MGGDNPPYNFEKMEEKRMGIDMKAFMKPELKDRGTMEFPGIERYKDAKHNILGCD